jgi:hypothetical protein
MHSVLSNNHIHQSNMISNRYLKNLTDQLDYAIEYATPIHQSWPVEQNEVDDDVYLSSLRQLDQNIAAAIAVTEGSNNSSKIANNVTSNPIQLPSSLRSSFNHTNRLSFINRPFAVNSNSFHQNLNNLTASYSDNNNNSINSNYLSETRGFPYDRLSQARLTSNRQLNSNNQLQSINQRTNSTCKIYQDLDEFKGHLDELKGQYNDFRGHLV